MRLFLVVLLAAAACGAAGVDWPMFRGPNGSGTVESSPLPVEFGPEQNVSWKADLPSGYSSSPVLYDGVLYVLKEGGILSALDPKTGNVLKQGRVEGALDGYFASPVAADGKLYTASKEGKVAVLKAGPDWEVLKVNDLGQEAWSTPAIADGRIYIRTQEALYCFVTN